MKLRLPLIIGLSLALSACANQKTREEAPAPAKESEAAEAPKPAAEPEAAEPEAAAPAPAEAAPAPAAAAPGEAGPPPILTAPVVTAREMVPGEGKLLATFETNMGKIEVELLEQEAPLTVANFVGLAMGKHWFRGLDGKPAKRPFYDGTVFHRVIPRFMIQGGDPMGKGIGGPGYQFRDEPQDLRFDRSGLLAMANSGPNTNGSQFFLTEVPTPHLNGRHTIFGRVVAGEELIGKIARVPQGPGNRPVQAVTLDKVSIRRASPGAR
ncbi:MAG: peptidylprolyl isomerase [Deltaproteobacteria bacterium]|nr:peptidylprolyl isomerase [Deltaproteobacteria bacterium]